MTFAWTYTKHGPQVHGPPLWTRSMDHLFRPGPWTPSWTTPLFKRQRTRPKVSERMFKFPKFWICGPSRYRFKMYLFLKCRYLCSLLRKRSYGFVTQSFLPHERLLQPVATSVRLCFETTNQPSPIVSPLANSNFCKKRSCHPQGNFRETISVHKLFSFNSCVS